MLYVRFLYLKHVLILCIVFLTVRICSHTYRLETIIRITVGDIFVNIHFYNSYHVPATSLYKSLKMFVKIQILILLIKIPALRGCESFYVWEN